MGVRHELYVMLLVHIIYIVYVRQTWHIDTRSLLKWPLVSLTTSFSRSLPNSAMKKKWGEGGRGSEGV